MKNCTILSLLFYILFGILKYIQLVEALTDDEDYLRTDQIKIQGSGDGKLLMPPDFYPMIDPYQTTRYSSTILFDFAFVRDYKYYMLPSAPPSIQLEDLHKEIIRNVEYELNSIKVRMIISVVSTRPGPMIRTSSSLKPLNSVYARINITQLNSAIIHPLTTIHLSKCGNRRILGNFTISDRVIFPLNVCKPDEVYCLPDCHKGTYCDGIVDCQVTSFDEMDSCPKCLYNQVRITVNELIIHSDEQSLELNCFFNTICPENKANVKWHFPIQLEQYESQFFASSQVRNLPVHLLTTGSYGCSVFGEVQYVNVTVFQKPQVSITRATADAETVILSETDGSSLTLWCNSTSGEINWHSISPQQQSKPDFHLIVLDNRHSAVVIDRLNANTDIEFQCAVSWGLNNHRKIKKNVKVVVMCDLTRHFQCLHSMGSTTQCLPISQKCDDIPQCSDKSDEYNCDTCKDDMIRIQPSYTKNKLITLTCQAKDTKCMPLEWTKDNKSLGGFQGLFAYGDILFIFQPKVYHRGSYTCSSGKSRAKQTAVIENASPPQLSISPTEKSINITTGQTKLIRCFVESNLNQFHRTPIWKLEKSKYLPQGVTMIPMSANEVLLQFNKADTLMGGTYTCQVEWKISIKSPSNSQEFESLTEPLYKYESVDVNVLPITCEAHERMCANGKFCIAKDNWCNGVQDCSDNSDESTCEKCKDGFVIVEPKNAVLIPAMSLTIQCFFPQNCNPVTWKFKSVKSNKFNLLDKTIASQNQVILSAPITQDMAGIYQCYSGMKSDFANISFVEEIIIEIDNEQKIIEKIQFRQKFERTCSSNFGEPKWETYPTPKLATVKSAYTEKVGPHKTKFGLTAAEYDATNAYICSVTKPNSQEILEKKIIVVYVEKLKCTQNEFMCDGKTRCVPNSKKCDRIADCEDKTDEEHCFECYGHLEIKNNQRTIVNEGWDVFECSVPNNACLPIDWAINSNSPHESLVSSLSHSLKFPAAGQLLYVFEPFLNHSGFIRCFSKAYPDKMAYASLQVDELKLTLDPPQFPNSIFMVKTSSELEEIACHSNYGSPRWIVPEERSVNQYGVKYFILNDSTVVLRFIKARPQASNEYICEVSHSNIKKRISIKVKVI